LLGSSGVGKSSLLNALEPGLKLRVGAISEKWRTGKHTTTAAELVPVAGVGYVVDTPGLREVATWGIDPDALGACFPDFRPYLDQCRFDNCSHSNEPACAVREALETGKLDRAHYGNYLKIREEAALLKAKMDKLERLKLKAANKRPSETQKIVHRRRGRPL